MAPRRETTHIAGVCPPLPPPDSPSSGLSQILLWSKAPKGCGLQAPRKGADNQRGNDPSYPSGVLIGLGLRVSSARHTPSEPWTPPPAAPWKGPGGSSRSQEEGSQTLEIPTLSRPGPSPGLEFPHLRGSLCPSMAPGSPEKAQGFNWLDCEPQTPNWVPLRPTEEKNVCEDGPVLEDYSVFLSSHHHLSQSLSGFLLKHAGLWGGEETMLLVSYCCCNKSP